MTDQYIRNEEESQQTIEVCRSVIPDLTAKGNFAWAARNLRRWSEAHVDLGLLHWRHGSDPRTHFQMAIGVFQDLRAMVEQHELDPSNCDSSLICAALSLMGHKTKIEFYDEHAGEDFRGYCYKTCVAHALQDQSLSETLEAALNRHLRENDQFFDRAFLTYMQLLGLRPATRAQDKIVAIAEDNWARRKTDKVFADGPPYDGFGVMNGIYVDIYLAAILEKIRWHGDSVHKWKWS